GYLAELRRNDQFVHLIMKTRERLELLYGDERTASGKVKAGPRKGGGAAEELRREKQRIFEQLRQEYAQLKSQWGGDTQYDDWFARQINNAHLNSVAAYYDLVPGFERLLAANGGDLEKFYQAAERLSRLPKAERQRALRTSK